MAPQQTMTIEVDVTAAEIIRRADARARAQGETLGAYLQHTLPGEEVNGKRVVGQLEAWNSFVTGMTAVVGARVPAGYVADDSRESMYGEGN